MQRLQKLQTALHAGKRLAERLKTSAFHKWLRVKDFAELDEHFQKLKGYTLRLIKENKALTSALPKKIVLETNQTKIPAHSYSQSTAVRREIVDMAEKLPASFQTSTSSPKPDDRRNQLYERLYREAAKRDLVNHQIRLFKEERDRQDTPFKPSLSVSGSVSDLPVFERLATSTPKLRESDRERMKADRELRGCTFTPNLETRSRNSSLNRSGSFERLFEDAASKRQKKRIQEREKEQQSLDECTFRPTVNSVKSSVSSTGDVFEKLYSVSSRQNYRSQLRKKQDLEVERSTIQSKECPFVPQLATKQVNVGEKMPYERLHSESAKRKTRLEELKTKVEREEQEKIDRSRSNPKKRTEISPSRGEEMRKLKEKNSDLRAVSGHPKAEMKPSVSEMRTVTSPKLQKHGDVLKTIYEELTAKQQ